MSYYNLSEPHETWKSEDILFVFLALLDMENPFWKRPKSSFKAINYIHLPSVYWQTDWLTRLHNALESHSKLFLGFHCFFNCLCLIYWVSLFACVSMDYANKKLDVHTQYNHEYLIRIMYGKPQNVFIGLLPKKVSTKFGLKDRKNL